MTSLSKGTTFCAIIATMNLLVLMPAIANDGSAKSSNTTFSSPPLSPPPATPPSFSRVTSISTDRERQESTTRGFTGEGGIGMPISSLTKGEDELQKKEEKNQTDSFTSASTVLLPIPPSTSTLTSTSGPIGMSTLAPMGLSTQETITPITSRIYSTEYPDNSSSSTQFRPTTTTTTTTEAPSIFATKNSTEITAQIKSNALLPCVIRTSVSDGITVSWIRRNPKEYHLLTVGLQTYSSDDRFQAIHAHSSEDWTLKIKFVQPRDEGIYECQASSHPPSSIFIKLNVVESRAEINGGPDKYIKSGSSLRLVCELKQSTAQPDYVFWYQGMRMINYDPDGRLEVTHSRFSSTLYIKNTIKSDSGNYSCVPSNAIPAFISVHILNGENPAAMHSSVQPIQISTGCFLLLILSILVHIHTLVSSESFLTFHLKRKS